MHIFYKKNWISEEKRKIYIYIFILDRPRFIKNTSNYVRFLWIKIINTANILINLSPNRAN